MSCAWIHQSDAPINSGDQVKRQVGAQSTGVPFAGQGSQSAPHEALLAVQHGQRLACKAVAHQDTTVFLVQEHQGTLHGWCCCPLVWSVARDPNQPDGYQREGNDSAGAKKDPPWKGVDGSARRLSGQVQAAHVGLT
jgi:hypothetical protein